MRHTEHPDPATPVPRWDDDEIRLVDLGLILWRRRLAVIATALSVTALGILIAMVLPKEYAYTTTLELGSRIDDGKTVLIEPPDAALAKITESYIPLARQHYFDRHPDETSSFKITARVPKGGQVIVLEVEGPETDAAIYREIQQQIAAALIADHDRISTVLRNSMELETQQEVRALEELKDGERLLRAQLQRVDLSAELVREQIADTQELIKITSANRLDAVREARDEARAMTLLMLDNEVRQNRERLAELEDQLQVGLAQKRDRLNNKLLDSQRRQDIQQAVIRHLELQLENLQQTRVVIAGLKSLEPVSLSRAVIALLGALLGAFVSLLVVFGLEFRERLRAELARDGEPPAMAEHLSSVEAG